MKTDRKYKLRGVEPMRVFTLIGILIAGLCLSLPAQEELVRNGSFEEGLSGWEVPAWVGSALPPAVERSQAVPPGLCYCL